MQNIGLAEAMICHSNKAYKRKRSVLLFATA